MNIEQILITSLIAWRLGYFITQDYLTQEPKEWILDRLPQNKPTRYITILTYCIYCITFWTAIIAYNLTPLLANILTIWATATLIATLHNMFSLEPSEENHPNNEIE